MPSSVDAKEFLDWRKFVFESTPALYRFQFRLFHGKLNFVASCLFLLKKSSSIAPVEDSNRSWVLEFNSGQSLSEVVVGILWKGDFFLFFVPVLNRLQRVVESRCGYFVLVGHFRIFGTFSTTCIEKWENIFVQSAMCCVLHSSFLCFFFKLPRFFYAPQMARLNIGNRLTSASLYQLASFLSLGRIF